MAAGGALTRRVAALRKAQADRAEERIRERLMELALRPQVIGSLAAFARLAWPTVEPGTELEWNWHLDLLFEGLQRQSLGERAYKDLVICVPPGTMKSLGVSVFRPAWEWLHWPERRRLCLAADDDLVIRDSRRTRSIIQSDWYPSLAAEAARRRDERPWAMANDQNQKSNFENTRKGFRQCRSLFSTMIGKRAHGWDVDDPVDAQLVINGTPDQVDARLREANNIIEKVLPTRVNEKKIAPRTIIMQRLHPNDPAGRAISRGWKVIQFAMEFDPADPNNHPADIRTEAGELLYAPTSRLFPAEVVAELKEELGTQAQGQLNQKPVPGEALRIKEAWLERKYSEPVDAIAHRALAVWFTSDANKKNKPGADNSSLQVWARCSDGWYILDCIERPMDYPEYERVVDAMLARWAPWLALKGGAMFEDTANGATYIQCRRPAFKGVTIHAFLPGETPGTDKSKAARADYTIKMAAALGLVLPDPAIASWVVQFRERLLGWPAIGRDTMDTCSQLHMRWTLEAAAVPAVSTAEVRAALRSVWG